MSTLMEELDCTIQHLEHVRDSQDLPPDKLLQHLDQLYEQQISLIDAAINEGTHEYAVALDAMSQAAKATKKAIDDLAELEKSIAKVATAIGKVSDVLQKIA